ncbi:serum response factor-binding protein 1 [Rhea pennata]|uniref:serum response factor-binding protein 1 n=1 Tax=Rhea pennata TaxID=8795 RepID=UPI002E2700C3
MAPVLNLNNEVVKMRKDVKKAKVLTIRRLTRHIGKLKLKKGSEDLILKNQKRAERLIEEIRAMKEIKPDQVTRLALRKEVNFESVCRKPNSTATERAIARLATHPILKSKIADLKAAVKAFKDARKKPANTHLSIKDKSEEYPKSAQPPNSNLDDQVVKVVQNQQACEDKTKTSTKIGANTEKELCESDYEQKIVGSEKACSPKEASLQAVEGRAVTQNNGGKKFDYLKRKKPISMNKFTATKESVGDVSDLEQLNEEEYFDDSTEERFYNQTSDSDSDSNDDFFIGKVKRKKKIAAVSDFSSINEKNRPQGKPLKKEKNAVPRTARDLVREEGKLHAKAEKLESVFCSLLSAPNQKSQNRRNTEDQPLKNRRTAFPKKEPQLKKQQFAEVAGIKCKNKKAVLEQPLHPSWEASKKRREQMSQITAFQGKRIKFDD